MHTMMMISIVFLAYSAAFFFLSAAVALKAFIDNQREQTKLISICIEKADKYTESMFSLIKEMKKELDCETSKAVNISESLEYANKSLEYAKKL